jgi:hypothetical protein
MVSIMFLLRLALKSGSLDLYLLGSWDYRLEPGN